MAVCRGQWEREAGRDCGHITLDHLKRDAFEIKEERRIQPLCQLVPERCVLFGLSRVFGRRSAEARAHNVMCTRLAAVDDRIRSAARKSDNGFWQLVHGRLQSYVQGGVVVLGQVYLQHRVIHPDRRHDPLQPRIVLRQVA